MQPVERKTRKRPATTEWVGWLSLIGSQGSTSCHGDTLAECIADAIQTAAYFFARGIGQVVELVERCAKCGGAGEVPTGRRNIRRKPCPECKGEPDITRFTFTIPAECGAAAVRGMESMGWAVSKPADTPQGRPAEPAPPDATPDPTDAPQGTTGAEDSTPEDFTLTGDPKPAPRVRIERTADALAMATLARADWTPRDVARLRRMEEHAGISSDVARRVGRALAEWERIAKAAPFPRPKPAEDSAPKGRKPARPKFADGQVAVRDRLDGEPIAHVPAMILGNVAVHDSLDLGRLRWSVTDTATGLRFGLVRTKTRAQSIARFAHASGVDFAKHARAGYRDLTARDRAIVDTIRDCIRDESAPIPDVCPPQPEEPTMPADPEPAPVQGGAPLSSADPDPIDLANHVQTITGRVADRVVSRVDTDAPACYALSLVPVLALPAPPRSVGRAERERHVRARLLRDRLAMMRQSGPIPLPGPIGTDGGSATDERPTAAQMGRGYVLLPTPAAPDVRPPDTEPRITFNRPLPWPTVSIGPADDQSTIAESTVSRVDTPRPTVAVKVPVTGPKGQVSEYAVTVLDRRAGRYLVENGKGAAYEVSEFGDHYGPSCSCPSFERTHRGIHSAGCKHIVSIRAAGLLDPVAAPARMPRFGPRSRPTAAPGSPCRPARSPRPGPTSASP